MQRNLRQAPCSTRLTSKRNCCDEWTRPNEPTNQQTRPIIIHPGRDIGVGAQSTLGKDIFVRKLCMKNYQNAIIFMIFGGKINRISEFYIPTPVSQIAFSRGDPLSIFRRVISCQKLNHGAIIWWRNHDASSFCFDTIPAVTDRQTDRHVAVAKTRSTHSVARVKVRLNLINVILNLTE